MKKVGFGLLLAGIAAIVGFVMIGCDDGSTGGNRTPAPQTVQYQSVGSDGRTYTLKITEKTPRYIAREGDTYELIISKAGQPDKVSRGTVTGVGDDGTLTLQPDNSDSEFTVTIIGDDMTAITGSIAVEGEEEPVIPPTDPLIPDIAVTFNSVSANGSSAQTTTQLTLIFNRAITELSANDITLSGVTGVTKGTLGGSGPAYTLPISGFTTGGILSVAVSKTGYNINGTPKTTAIYYYSGGGNNVPPENKPAKDRWWTWAADDSTATLSHTVDNEGVCTITVGGTAMPNYGPDHWFRWKAIAGFNYTAQADKSYVYKFEAWTQSGTRDVNVQYYSDDDTNVYLQNTVSITSTRTTYTVNGDILPKGGIRDLAFHCADQLGTFYVKILSIEESVPPEQWTPPESRWWNWVSDDSPVTVNKSFDAEGTCIVTVEGTPVDHDWESWKGSVGYSYTGLADRNYEYKFEAWTQSGARDLHITFSQYSNNSFADTLDDFWITDERTTYTLTGGIVPRSGTHSLIFNCADQLGTFYVKMLDIKPGNYGVLGNIHYAEEPNSIAIIGYTIDGRVVPVTIPATINGKPVTEIRKSAFDGQTFITSVSMPNTIAIIGQQAFQNSNYLTSINISTSVTSIEYNTFAGCVVLPIITIPAGVTSIGYNAFGGCTSLTSVTFQGRIPENGFNETAFGNKNDNNGYLGDLRDKYLAGGPGRYTRTSGGETWTRQ